MTKPLFFMQRKLTYMIGTCTATLNAREWTADSLISKIHIINPLYKKYCPLLIYILPGLILIRQLKQTSFELVNLKQSHYLGPMPRFQYMNH